MVSSWKIVVEIVVPIEGMTSFTIVHESTSPMEAVAFALERRGVAYQNVRSLHVFRRD